MTPDEIADRLGLQPHPEGGMYVETWRDAVDGSRGHGSAIYFLLRAGEVSRWHVVDAVEVYHYYAGAPLDLRCSADGERVTNHVLGPDLANGQRPQVVVPTGWWQSAQSLGAWSLVGCTVSPAFVFEGFEMASEGWEPGRAGR